MVSQLGPRMIKHLHRALIVALLYTQVPKEKIHICLLNHQYFLSDDTLSTRLNHVTYRVGVHRNDEVVYTRYCIIMLSGHKNYYCLGIMSI